jgi:hypothetical protein
MVCDHLLQQPFISLSASRSDVGSNSPDRTVRQEMGDAIRVLFIAQPPPLTTHDRVNVEASNLDRPAATSSVHSFSGRLRQCRRCGDGETLMQRNARGGERLREQCALVGVR